LAKPSPAFEYFSQPPKCFRFVFRRKRQSMTNATGDVRPRIEKITLSVAGGAEKVGANTPEDRALEMHQPHSALSVLGYNAYDGGIRFRDLPFALQPPDIDAVC
jgi:hypothetical protein